MRDLGDIRKRIAAQADALPDGWTELKLPAMPKQKMKAGVIRVPRIPFERWTHNAFRHRWDEWPRVSPPFMRMAMDDSNHTDWWLGAGYPRRMLAFEHCNLTLHDVEDFDGNPKRPLTPAERRAVQVNKAAWSMRMGHNDRGGYMFLVKPRSEVKGRVVWVKTPADVAEFVKEAVDWRKSRVDLIAVLPDASVDYDLVLHHAAAIIVQNGNRAAHVVKNARVKHLPVVLCEDAFKRYFEWERLVIHDRSVYRSL